MHGLYDATRLFGYDPVFCLLALHHSQEIDWSRYSGDHPPFSGYDFRTEQLLDVPPLRAKKRSKLGSGFSIDVPAGEVCWPQEIQLARIQSRKSEWLELSGASALGGGAEVAILYLPVFHDFGLLFERDAA